MSVLSTISITSMQAKVPSAHADLAQWLDYYLAMHATEIDMGLTRIRQVAQSMALLSFAKMKVITVGGTNGKGTTCAMLESILREQGLRVGVYSSPHILHYNERIRINGVDASDAEIIAGFQAIELARGEISLTFFEVATLLGLYLFQQQAVEVAILEVGLGGRLDATNMVDADLAIVTSIGLDHQDYLGDTRESIGYEKAGIFKTGKFAVTGEPELPQTVTDLCQELGVDLKRVGHEFSYQQQGNVFNFEGLNWSLQNLPVPQLPLPNAATCLAGLALLFPELPEQSIRQGLQQATLSGRFETIQNKPRIILDVAHNAHAANYLLTQLQALQPLRLVALCGMLKDKDYDAVLTLLAPYVDAWYLTDLASERSAAATDLAKALQNQVIKAKSVDTFQEISLAWQSLTQDLQMDDVVIVFGSFYTVSGVKAVLNLG